MEKIILASSSPRRKELLHLIGVSFTVTPSNVNEVVEEGVLSSQIVEQLALLKARAVSASHKEGIIIGADTIVVFNGEILGKPNSKKEAHRMLKRLQGNTHEVFSGVAVLNALTGKYLVSHQVTKVYMKTLTDDEINAYIDTNEPMDKAGSYGIQGIGALFIEKIDGDYFNVVGLPLSLLSKLLTSFGINVLTDLVHTEN